MSQRAIAGAPAVISTILVDQYGAARAAAGTVTVEILRADGSELVAAGTATSAGTGLGAFTYTLTAAQTATLDLLTVNWTESTGGTTTTYVDIAGRLYVSVPKVRDAEPAVSDPAKFPSSAILDALVAAEHECERICRRTFVPRYRRRTFDGTGTCAVTVDDELRSVRSISVDGTALAAGVVSAAAISAGEIVLDGETFTAGRSNVVIEYEHGWNGPPADLVEAFLVRVRDFVLHPTRAVADRATSFTVTEGGTFALAQPGHKGWETGIPYVDAIYKRYARPHLVVA